MTEPGTEPRIDELSKRVDFGFEQVDRRAAQFEAGVDGRFDQVDHRFDRVEGDIRELRADMKAGFEGVNASFEGVNARFEGVNARFDAMQQQMTRFFAVTLGSIVAGVIVGVVLFLLSHS